MLYFILQFLYIFIYRHTRANIHNDVLGGANIFLARTPFWRHLRSRLTPLFTKSRTKKMFYLINNIGQNLDKYLTELPLTNNNTTTAMVMDIKDMCARYTTDVISSCAFGIQANSIDMGDNSDFRKYGRKFFDFSIYRAIELSCFFFMPELISIFKFKVYKFKLYNLLLYETKL